MKLKVNFVRIGMNFRTVLFPLTILEISQSLEKLGYEISPSLPSPRPTGRMTGVGEIARKGRTSVRINADAQVLRVAGISQESVMQVLDSIVTIIQEDYDVDINEFARFYVFSINYEYPTEKRCYETIAKALRAPVFNDIEGIMEEEIWPLELRFGGAKLSVNSDNWFDITIQPSFERNDSYKLNVVYRNTDVNKWRTFMKELDNKIIKILKLIEG